MSRQPTDIVLYVHHVARELDVACIVKHLAATRHGVAVEIASTVAQPERALAMYEPLMVALPFCRGAATDPVSHILQAWPDAVYLNLNYEQIFRKHQQAFKAPFDSFARDHVLHHAWGAFYADYLVGHGVHSNNIFVNGNPVYALYRAPYASYFDSKRDLARRFGLDPGRRWLFVAENYGAAFMGDRAAFLPVEGTEEEAEQVRRFAVDSLQEAVRWWGRAAEADSTEVIVRPRPTTPTATLRKVCEDVLGRIPVGMHIIKDGTVREWILASDVTASSYSTTLIEAAIAGKPVCMFAPLPFPDSMHTEWQDLAPKAESLTEFLDVVGGNGSSTASQPLREWAERLMLSNGDPVVGLVDYFAAVLRGDEEPPTPVDLDNLTLPESRHARQTSSGIGWPAQARTLVGGALRRVRRRRINRNESDVFDAPDVDRRVSRWAETLGQGSS